MKSEVPWDSFAVAGDDTNDTSAAICALTQSGTRSLVHHNKSVIVEKSRSHMQTHAALVLMIKCIDLDESSAGTTMFIWWSKRAIRSAMWFRRVVRCDHLCKVSAIDQKQKQSCRQSHGRAYRHYK